MYIAKLKNYSAQKTQNYVLAPGRSSLLAKAAKLVFKNAGPAANLTRKRLARVGRNIWRPNRHDRSNGFDDNIAQTQTTD